MQVHRVATKTEQIEAGVKSSNQLDRLKDILKSEPRKKGLLTGGVTFNSIPPLMVTNNQYSDAEKQFDDHKGFRPGQSMVRRITDFGNVVPVHSYERKTFIDQHGKDFE